MTDYRTIKGYTAYGQGNNCGACGYTGYGKKTTNCGWCTEEQTISIKYFMDGTITINNSDGLYCASGERYSNGVCSISTIEGGVLLREKIIGWDSIDELSDMIANIIGRWDVTYQLLA